MNDKVARGICCGIFLLMLSVGDLFAIEHQLGTVFYSPEERAALVAKRNGAEDPNDIPDPIVSNEADSTESPTSVPYAVSGIVTRSGGKSVVWINGQPVAEAQPDPNLPPLRLYRDHIVIDGKSVKVGEVLDVISGKRVAPLPVGAVKVIP